MPCFVKKLLLYQVCNALPINLLLQSEFPGAPYKSLSGFQHWIGFVFFGLQQTYANFPFLAYGTDWLAFGHLVIALFFIGPFIDPLKNEWVLYCGIAACIAVFPLALICGPIRQIPLFWTLIDCSFGLFGLLPLLYCLSLTRRMRKLH